MHCRNSSRAFDSLISLSFSSGDGLLNNSMTSNSCSWMAVGMKYFINAINWRLCYTSPHLLWLYSLVCVGPGRKPRRQVFSQHSSYIENVLLCSASVQTFEPRCEKTGLWGFRPGSTQTGLYDHTRWLEN